MPDLETREHDPQFRKCELFVRYNPDGGLVDLSGPSVILPWLLAMKRNVCNHASAPSSPSPRIEHKTTIRIYTSANVAFHPPAALAQPPSRTPPALDSSPAPPLPRWHPPPARPARPPPLDARNRTRRRSFGHRAGAPPHIVCAVCRARSTRGWSVCHAASRTWYMLHTEKQILNGVGVTERTVGQTNG